MTLIPPWIENTKDLETPCYLIDQRKLDINLSIINQLKNKTNCIVILALKGFSTFEVFSNLMPVIDGVTASSIYETRLGIEEFNKNIHIHSIGMDKIESIQFNDCASHITFNSINQLNLFKKYNHHINPSLGIRINPEISTVKTNKYDPCGAFSRLGIPISRVPSNIFDQVDGMHFHALCEQNTAPLFKCLDTIEKKFGENLKKLNWINWGGGHQLTSPEYKLNALIKKINEWEEKYNVQIILEPGEAIAINSGYYVTKILDIIENNKKIAICDISATAHMPDILEYPYRPDILNSGKENEKKYNYIIGGNTCLAGDIIGEYSFDTELIVNNKLILNDMAHYTIVKTSNFNGVKQPSIGIIEKSGKIRMIKFSSYFNFKERLS